MFFLHFFAVLHVRTICILNTLFTATIFVKNLFVFMNDGLCS